MGRWSGKDIALLKTSSWMSALVLTLFAGAAPAASAPVVLTYRGLCDASAAVALDADHFIVAGDEDNTLRVYRRGRPESVREAPLASFLGSGDKESDLEAAAAVGSRIYWIASHGRNSKGKPRPERQRFFATDIDTAAQPPGVISCGKTVPRFAGRPGRRADAGGAASRRCGPARTRGARRVEHRRTGGNARWQPADRIPQPGAERPGTGGALAQPGRIGHRRSRTARRASASRSCSHCGAGACAASTAPLTAKATGSSPGPVPALVRFRSTAGRARRRTHRGSSTAVRSPVSGPRRCSSCREAAERCRS